MYCVLAKIHVLITERRATKPIHVRYASVSGPCVIFFTKFPNALLNAINCNEKKNFFTEQKRLLNVNACTVARIHTMYFRTTVDSQCPRTRLP